MATDAATKPRERAAHLGPERRRPQILDAALQIAAESGTAAVTIGAVATHLGVTRPVVYSCFKDRVELLAALLDREGESLRETLRQPCTPAAATTLRQRSSTDTARCCMPSRASRTPGVSCTWPMPTRRSPTWSRRPVAHSREVHRAGSRRR